MTEIKKSYKSGQIFWGVLFLTIGVLFLLAKRNLGIELPERFLDYWPVLIVLWGLAILTKGTFIRSIISAFTGFIVALFLFTFFFGNEIGFIDNDIDDSDNNSVYSYFEEFNPVTQNATFLLRTGAGHITLNSGTDKLIAVTSKGFENTFSFNTRYRDENARIVLRNANQSINLLTDGNSRALDIKINTLPEWSFDLKLGAAKIDMDLSELNVSTFNLSTGATTSEIKFGNKQDLLKINVEMGAATLSINIPENSGCLIKGDMVLVAKDLDGFKKIGSKRYETENYDSAEKKIIINFNGGVSTLKIERY